MEKWIPFIPERASTVAGRVDALYFFLVGVSVFFALGTLQTEVDVAHEGQSAVGPDRGLALHTG